MAVVAILVAGVGCLVFGDGGDDGDDRASGARRPLISATLEREGDTGTLELTGLRQLGGDRVYQAWVQHGDVMEDSSLFAARSRRHGHGGDPAR